MAPPDDSAKEMLTVPDEEKTISVSAGGNSDPDGDGEIITPRLERNAPPNEEGLATPVYKERISTLCSMPDAAETAVDVSEILPMAPSPVAQQLQGAPTTPDLKEAGLSTYFSIPVLEKGSEITSASSGDPKPVVASNPEEQTVNPVAMQLNAPVEIEEKQATPASFKRFLSQITFRDRLQTMSQLQPQRTFVRYEVPLPLQPVKGISPSQQLSHRGENVITGIVCIKIIPKQLDIFSLLSLSAQSLLT